MRPTLSKARRLARPVVRRVRRLLQPIFAPNGTPAPNLNPLEEDGRFPVSHESIARFRNRHRGQRCFIVGNGPSLNVTDLTELEDEYTIGVNGIFYKTDEMGFRPTYYVVEDTHVIIDNLARINAYEAEHKFFPSIYSEKIRSAPNVSFFRMNRGFYEQKSPNYGIPRWSTDCAERIYCGQSVTYINLQLAFYMGFDPVYLIGVDFSYTVPDSAIVEGVLIESTEDDPNHFHPEYFGKGKRWKMPQLERVRVNYEMADLVFRSAGRKVYDATLGGKLDVFEKVDFDGLFSR